MSHEYKTKELKIDDKNNSTSIFTSPSLFSDNSFTSIELSYVGPYTPYRAYQNYCGKKSISKR